jgi:hypothetical protein
VSPVDCTSLVGIEYSRPEPFDPTRTPALVAGGVSAVVAFAATGLVATSRNDNREAMEDRLRSE